MTAALLVFVFSFLVIAGARLPLTRLDRPAGALLGAVGMVLCGVVEPGKAVRDGVNHDTLLLLLGMMIISAHMSEARLFRFASWFTLTHVHSPRRLVVAIVFVSGALSAVLVNDTICLMFTPLVVQLARDTRLRPLPLLLALAFGANAGSVATPTGNPQNMIIGTLSGLSYGRFTAVLALPALVSLVLVAALLLALFRRELAPTGRLSANLPRPDLQPALAALCLVTLAGLMAGFFAGANLAWTSLAGASFLLLTSPRPPRAVLLQVDWVLILFFGALFVLVYGVNEAGIAQAMFDGLKPLLGDTLLQQAAVFGLFTVLASQVVSNVPFVLLASSWMPNFLDPTFLWVLTALVSTLAGNLTMVGSVANLIVFEGAGEDGRVGFLEFLKYGALVTAATLLAGFAVLWTERSAGWI
jgi:Na+/H+ antiporter NhaD/arsenite permease-like protein